MNIFQQQIKVSGRIILVRFIQILGQITSWSKFIFCIFLGVFVFIGVIRTVDFNSSKIGFISFFLKKTTIHSWGLMWFAISCRLSYMNRSSGQTTTWTNPTQQMTPKTIIDTFLKLLRTKETPTENNPVINVTPATRAPIHSVCLGLTSLIINTLLQMLKIWNFL